MTSAFPTRSWALGAAIACLAIVGGCGGGLNVAPVTGKVTVDGKPLPSGHISFISDTGPMATGVIGPDGTYSLTTFDEAGAVVGNYKVIVMATTVSGGTTGPATLEEEQKAGSTPGVPITIPGKVVYLAPEKYSQPETSGLTAEVKDEANELNFDLKSGK